MHACATRREVHELLLRNAQAWIGDWWKYKVGDFFTILKPSWRVTASAWPLLSPRSSYSQALHFSSLDVLECGLEPPRRLFGLAALWVPRGPHRWMRGFVLKLQALLLYLTASESISLLVAHRVPLYSGVSREPELSCRPRGRVHGIVIFLLAVLLSQWQTHRQRVARRVARFGR